VGQGPSFAGAPALLVLGVREAPIGGIIVVGKGHNLRLFSGRHRKEADTI